MKKIKRQKSGERSYSYSEYVSTFYPDPLPIPKPFSEPESTERQDPKVIGGRLALESVKRAERELQK